MFRALGIGKSLTGLKKKKKKKTKKRKKLLRLPEINKNSGQIEISLL